MRQEITSAPHPVAISVEKVSFLDARYLLVARAANSVACSLSVPPSIKATQDRVPLGDGVRKIPFLKIVSKPLSKNVGKRYQAAAGVEADGAAEFVSPK